MRREFFALYEGSKLPLAAHTLMARLGSWPHPRSSRQLRRGVAAVALGDARYIVEVEASGEGGLLGRH